ncbi:MAG TPA: tetratricopeptide repeat protein [Lentibacillus sp.]|uniref:tetratricopeptide repeat protein n=1 Tax=Lentibacillus sp. TaxID=1925746 RepID=UPI002B4B0FB2|nr:tetratricopeptide repeat protein [Lentibacillus sp.]HLR62627.1 tetratricopeptide repeat protein [Lentibacillus sp.]
MEGNRENVILFPKWRTALEEESLVALKEKRYKEALVKLDQLLEFDVKNHEIIIGKLMCLMELNRYKEAQDFCEGLLIHKDENYYQYVHIYLTILFQTSQYHLLMDQVEQEKEKNTVPDDMKEQFQQLYDMSRKMRHDIRIEKAPEYINELFKAVEEENHVYQYRLVEQIRKMDLTPTGKEKALLTDDRVHPVAKTGVFIWLQEKDFSERVWIHKLGSKYQAAPEDTPKLDSHPIVKQILSSISDEEQKNPTLYRLMEQVLHHYLYVRYPLMPAEDEAPSIAEALMKIGEDYLDIHKGTTENGDDSLNLYMDEIKMCEALYSTIIEV